MNLIIACGDGKIICDRDVILQQSTILSEHFASEVCSCNLSVIIPDFNTDLVRLAITLLDRVKSDMELNEDLLDTVAPVFSLLQIQCVSTSEEGFLNPDTGDIQVCIK